MKGRKPLTPHLRILTGNAGKRAVPKEVRDQVRASLVSGVPLTSTIGDPPEELSEAAKAMWREFVHVAPWLEVNDRPALTAFCLACVRMAEAEKAIKVHGMTYETVNGGVGTRPEVRIAAQCANAIRTLGGELGFTPIGRTRLALNPGEKPRASDLPGELQDASANPSGA